MGLNPATHEQFNDAVDEVKTLHGGKTLTEGRADRWTTISYHAGSCVLCKMVIPPANGVESDYPVQLFVDRESLDKLDTSLTRDNL